MGRKNLSDIRRQQIIEGFYRLIAEKGFINATTREITKAAGVSKGVLHHYFATKEEMVLGVMEYEFGSYINDLRRELAYCASATDRLKFVFTFFSNRARFDEVHNRVWIEAITFSKSNKSCERFVSQGYKEVIEVVLDIIHDGIEAGEFRQVDPLAASELVWILVDGANLLSSVHAIQTPAETLRDEIIEVFMTYITGEK